MSCRIERGITELSDAGPSELDQPDSDRSNLGPGDSKSSGATTTITEFDVLAVIAADATTVTLHEAGTITLHEAGTITLHEAGTVTSASPRAGDEPDPVADRVSPVIIPWGPANLGRRWLQISDPPAPDALTNALGAVDDYLADADRGWRQAELLGRPNQAITGICVSGEGVGAISRLETGVDAPLSELAITRADLEEIFRIAATEARTELAANPGLQPGDEDILVAVLCIVASIARRYRVPTIWCRAMP